MNPIMFWFQSPMFLCPQTASVIGASHAFGDWVLNEPVNRGIGELGSVARAVATLIEETSHGLLTAVFREKLIHELRTGASCGWGTSFRSFHWYPNGAAPPSGLPSLARTTTDALTPVGDFFTLHCAIAAIHGIEKPASGVEVSMDSWSESVRSYIHGTRRRNSRSSLVLRASRASLEKISAEIRPARTSLSIPLTFGMFGDGFTADAGEVIDFRHDPALGSA